MPKIVMIRSAPLNPDPRLEREALTLSDAGNSVCLLGWDRSLNCLKNEITEKYIVHRFKFRAPFGKKIIFFLPIWWIYVLCWLLKNKWDIVHVTDFDSCTPGLLAAIIKRKPIVYEIYDYYPDKIKLPRFIRQILVMYDKFTMRYVNKIIILDECKYEQIDFDDKEKVVVIYNGPNDLCENILPQQREQGILKVFYGGTFFPGRDILSMIIACSQITGVHITIAGYGYPTTLVEEIKNLCDTTPNAEFLGKISNTDLLSISSESDVLFALYDPQIRNNKFASPTKLFDAMMCGKPFITNSNSSTANLVLQEKCGLIVPYGDVSALKNILLSLRDNPSMRKELGNNGRKAYLNKYSWKIMSKKLENTYLILNSQSQTKVKINIKHK